jgi:hypothetical protein
MGTGFLYFVPGFTRPITFKEVRTFCLGYAFESGPQSGQCAINTPTGTAGMIFADKARHAEGRVKMDMENQVWRKMPRPGQQDVYVGYWKDAKPGPDDLKREKQVGGYQVAMLDGSRWTVPLVMMFEKTSEQLLSGLPTKMALDDQGEVVAGDVIDRYQFLYDAMSDYAAAMQAGKLIELLEALPLSKVCKDARTLLAANYIVDLPEIHALDIWQMIRPEECMEAVAIILAAIDYATFNEWDTVKKNRTPSPAAAVG